MARPIYGLERHPIIIIIIKQGRSQLADEEAKSLFMQHKFQLNINTFSRKNKTDGEAYALPGHPLATPMSSNTGHTA